MYTVLRYAFIFPQSAFMIAKSKALKVLAVACQKRYDDISLSRHTLHLLKGGVSLFLVSIQPFEFSDARHSLISAT
jgi:hypothetical protein